MKYRVVIEQDEDGVYVAQAPSLPGCISQGKTRNEALKNIAEAISLYLESLKAHGNPVPPPITEEVIEVKARADCRACRAGRRLRHLQSSDTHSTRNAGVS